MFGNSVHFRCDFHYICMKMTGNKGTPPALMKYSCECNTFRPQASIVACPQDSFMMTPLAEKATTTKKKYDESNLSISACGASIWAPHSPYFVLSKNTNFRGVEIERLSWEWDKKGFWTSGGLSRKRELIEQEVRFWCKIPLCWYIVGVAVFSNASVFLWTHKEYRLSFESLFFVH